MIIEQMTDLIGNTPLLKIPRHVTGLKNIELYAKLEMMNPFGSVKDRTAWAMIKDDIPSIQKSGQTIYENSSGNTAKSLQAIASIYGLKFRLVSALTKVQEQKDVLYAMGAEVEEIATASDCFDPSDPNDPQYMIERKMAADPDSIYFPSQFTNMKNPEFHEQTTAQEILDDVGAVDYFFGGLGTTGSSLGISMRLKCENPDLKSIGITAQTGHFIPGIRNMSQMMESTMFRRDYYDRILPLTEGNALQGMMILMRQCAVLCGPSSGANFYAALEYLKEEDGKLNAPRKAVFIVCDRMEWYISYLRERMPELFGQRSHQSPLHNFDSSLISIVPHVDTAYINVWREQNAGSMIIDTRASQSFDLFHIPGSMNMPQELFEKWIVSERPLSPETPILVVCAIGERSRHYAAYLCSRGYKAYNLDGGIMSWVDRQQAA